jgi:outer membrane lipoprotein-sorting protein
MKLIKLFVFLLSLFPVLSIFPQENNPDKILEKVLSTFEKISDYSVEVHVNIDVSFLKIPDMDAKIYFKQPDKMRIKSDNFALLPKQGFNFSPVSLLRKNHTAIFVKNENLNGIETAVIKVIPLEEVSDLILSTLWIDLSNYVIIKVESTARPSGTYTINFEYAKVQSDYFLPVKMTFSFPADQMLFRKNIKDPFNSSDNQNDSENDKEKKEGKVTVSYSNYEVNKGIPDEIFNTDQKEK